MSFKKTINYIHFDTIDSTNSWAKQNAETLDPRQITCITAKEQTAGRGRFNRRWISPRGQNIYASLYFCLSLDCPIVMHLGQLFSLSCAKILKEKGFSPQVKWPNDLLMKNKKIAGILTETISFTDRLGIILGIGININMSEPLLSTIDQPAISLAQLSEETWTMEQILNPLLDQFLKDLKLLQEKGFKPFRKTFEEFLAFKGKKISFYNGQKHCEGICKGIDDEGRLTILLPTQEKIALNAGEMRAVRRAP